MEKFKPKVILAPTDFSDLATFSLGYAQKMARCSGAKLVIVYADPFLPPPHFTALQMDTVVESIEHSKQAARDYLARYAKDAVAVPVEVDAVVVEDLPVPAIVKTAEEKQADLIVMGTHGRSGISRAMLGSVTERVLRETTRPVLTVRQKKGQIASTGEIEIKKVLCPVNFSEVSHQSLAHAVAVADCFGAELTILHVSETELSPTAMDAEKGRLCNWISPEFRQKCSIQESVEKGNPAERILSLAGKIGCDMIVLGAQHRRFFDSTVIGTTTVRVTRHAPCPVLTVIRH
jgi:nucleotide-binding universal stress UspA family protein